MPLPPILQEDETFIAFDKPSGMLIAPDRWDKKRENMMGLVHDKFGHGVANVHRLDADTSGVVLCSKSKEALDYLSGQFQSKTVLKTYLALVVVLPPERAMKVVKAVRGPDGGLPPEFTMEQALGEDERQPGRMRIFKGRGGKASVTEFRVLENFGRFAWVECRPLTGRTHQIRVHLQSLGHPLVGDPVYGKSRRSALDLLNAFKRQALHAERLSLQHPDSGDTVAWQAELPADFAQLLVDLRAAT